MHRFKSQFETQFMKLRALNEAHEEQKSGLVVSDEVEREKMMKIQNNLIGRTQVVAPITPTPILKESKPVPEQKEE